LPLHAQVKLPKIGPETYFNEMHETQAEVDLILTLTGALGTAVVLGFITEKLRMSPIVGYLLAGIAVGPFTPGFVANHELASQGAEIGVVLLMFGVGLHFHLKDLMAVRRVAIPGALVQILAASLAGMIATRLLGWSWSGGLVFGMAISVASTVVLIRVLSDNNLLATPEGHLAVGWLIVEDLFTVLVLLLLPAVAGGTSGSHAAGNAWLTLGIALLKLAALVLFALSVGRKMIPAFLQAVARTGSGELFTLTVLVVALGLAVAAARLFGASMPLGAFIAGMIVGQSEFGARAASHALPMRDAFAVLFFVSVGMLLDPSSITAQWPLMLLTLGIILAAKPLAALLVVLAFRRPWTSALVIALSLTQIGEFSFILAALATNMKLLPPEATNALVFSSIVSITLNPLLFRTFSRSIRRLEKQPEPATPLIN
jgi:CPA2 family monovalent cation:H+ antiporter-2